MATSAVNIAAASRLSMTISSFDIFPPGSVGGSLTSLPHDRLTLTTRRMRTPSGASRRRGLRSYDRRLFRCASPSWDPCCARLAQARGNDRTSQRRAPLPFDALPKRIQRAWPELQPHPPRSLHEARGGQRASTRGPLFDGKVGDHFLANRSTTPFRRCPPMCSRAYKKMLARVAVRQSLITDHIRLDHRA